MTKQRMFKLTVLAGAAVLLVSIIFPLTKAPCEVQAQIATPSVELAYDDGQAFKTMKESVGGCDACYTYQGVRFGLGGVALASITSVRFYAGGHAGALEVVITDITRQHVLVEPIKVNVSATQWYTVAIPETMVSDDFWVWIKADGRAMPYHDAVASGHSFYMEFYKLTLCIPLEKGDLMIRASIRAEIHVGEGQDYATIQEAVDAASESLTIVVHDGTYPENVVVNKKLAIISKDGTANTIVTAANSGASAFTIGANEVMISGLTIQGASGPGAAGVQIAGFSACTVSSNIFSNNHYGVSISSTGRNNFVVDNEFASNVYGIWVEGQVNNIAGNRFSQNTAPLGSALYLSASAGDNEVHFNTFTAAAGSGQIPQVYSDVAIKMANCVNNWWGSPSGPYHAAANPNGTGATVGEGVQFSPWLKAEPVAVKSATTSAGIYGVDASREASTALQKTGTGTPTVWIARYAGNPGGEFPQTSIGKWLDVYFNNTGNLQEVEIRVQYSAEEVAGLNEGSLRLYWWNGTDWRVCSNAGVNTDEDFVWARLSPTSNPAIGNLGGAPFTVGTTSSGFAWWWILVAIVALILLVVVGRFLLGRMSRARDYYE